MYAKTYPVQILLILPQYILADGFHQGVYPKCHSLHGRVQSRGAGDEEPVCTETLLVAAFPGQRTGNHGCSQGDPANNVMTEHLKLCPVLQKNA